MTKTKCTNTGNHKDDDETIEQEQRDKKKRRESSLRSIEADLKVIVGGDPMEDHNSGTIQVYWYVSSVLASQSGYVDTYLSTSVPTNNDSNPSKNDHTEIHFSDITPSQWERMMRFLTNPLALESMTIEDAIELALLYDQYEFPIGIKICDDVLYKKTFFQTSGNPRVMCHRTSPDPQTVDRFVKIIILSLTINLRKTFYWGRIWLNSVLESAFEYDAVEYFPLTKAQIRRLVPVIIRDQELSETADYKMPTNCYTDDNKVIKEYLDGGEEEIGHDILETISNISHPYSEVDITNPLFPDLFLANMENSFNFAVALRRVPRIKVVLPVGAHPASGYYDLVVDDTIYYGHEAQYPGCGELRKDPNERKWQLLYNHEVLYLCQHPQFSQLPPKTGWVGMEYSNLPVPTLEY